MTREQLRERTEGLWLPASRVATIVSLLAMLVMGADIVREVQRIEDQLTNLTTAQEGANAALRDAQTAAVQLGDRVTRVEVHQADHERRISALEAGRP